ncbi:MAG: 1-(5-phosphoribosyl)-5-[(5-phosphoribosylamino)methylideneamino]imidazole-4-carboxamide isomerase [Anaerolineales bacterium]
MSKFIIYPAVDLSHGKVVRLRQGKSDQETIYGEQPLETVAHWITAGVKWLHIVNLDGAFGKVDSQNRTALREILQFTAIKDISVQFGGGLRTLANVNEVIQMGVQRVMLSTLVIEQPLELEKMLELYSAQRIVVAVDCKEEKVYSHGWQHQSSYEITNFLKQLEKVGVHTLLITDINRDGMQTGVNIALLRKIKEQFDMDVILAGGVARLEDVIHAKVNGAAGVVIGKALYEGNISIEQALFLEE